MMSKAVIDMISSNCPNPTYPIRNSQKISYYLSDVQIE